jgi:hypothetical protein
VILANHRTWHLRRVLNTRVAVQSRHQSSVPTTTNPGDSLPPTRACGGQILLPPCCHKDQDPTAIPGDRASDPPPTSADVPRAFALILPRLPRLKPSRRVSCTNRCTRPVFDLEVYAFHRHGFAHASARPQTPVSSPLRPTGISHDRFTESRHGPYINLTLYYLGLMLGK